MEIGKPNKDKQIVSEPIKDPVPDRQPKVLPQPSEPVEPRREPVKQRFPLKW
jgi:hypothetical protein